MSLDAKHWRDHALAKASRYVAKPLMTSPLPWPLLRRTIEAMAYFYSPPSELEVTYRDIAGHEARVARPADPQGRVLWLHGGAFTVCSPETHAQMTDVLALHGLEVIVPRYRLAPEHPFPAGYEDCLAVARAIAAEGAFTLGGDSAGGGLAAAVLAQLLADGTPPARVCLISPAADFDTTRPVPEDADDMFLTPDLMHRIAGDYAAGVDPRDPRLSPVHARFPGCPPVLFHCSKGELLEGDTDALATRMREDGGHVTVHKADGLPHVWHICAGQVPAADRALDAIATFLKDG